MPGDGTSTGPDEVLLIASPLESEHVARIRDAAAGRVEVLHDPDLIPRARFPADHTGDPGFALDAAGQARWRELLARATILWDFPRPMDGFAGGLAEAPNVKWVQATSSGVGQTLARYGLIDHPVLVTSARGVHAGPLAEFVMMTVLTNAKQLRHLQDEQRRQRWQRHSGDDLPGKTITVIGAGAIGAEIGRLARAFGMCVTALVRHPDRARASALYADRVLGSNRLAESVRDADYIVVCAPHTDETESLIDAEIINAMKEGVVFVNVGRGQVVAEDALIAALRDGRIGFAALDVTRHEPLPEDSPLWTLPNVLISPHSASTVVRENARIAQIFLGNLELFLAGEPGKMRNLVDKSRLY